MSGDRGGGDRDRALRQLWKYGAHARRRSRTRPIARRSYNSRPLEGPGAPHIDTWTSSASRPPIDVSRCTPSRWCWTSCHDSHSKAQNSCNVTKPGTPVPSYADMPIAWSYLLEGGTGHPCLSYVPFSRRTRIRTVVGSVRSWSGTCGSWPLVQVGDVGIAETGTLRTDAPPGARTCGAERHDAAIHRSAAPPEGSTARVAPAGARGCDWGVTLQRRVQLPSPQEFLGDSVKPGGAHADPVRPRHGRSPQQRAEAAT